MNRFDWRVADNQDLTTDNIYANNRRSEEYGFKKEIRMVRTYAEAVKYNGGAKKYCECCGKPILSTEILETMEVDEQGRVRPEILLMNMCQECSARLERRGRTFRNFLLIALNNNMKENLEFLKDINKSKAIYANIDLIKHKRLIDFEAIRDFIDITRGSNMSDMDGDITSISSNIIRLDDTQTVNITPDEILNLITTPIPVEVLNEGD